MVRVIPQAVDTWFGQECLIALIVSWSLELEV